MTPLSGHAGWGGIAEAIGCMFLCVAAWVVGLALAGAIFRSPTLVVFSFVKPAIIGATSDLSGLGYAALAIIMLAPLCAAAYLFRTYRPTAEGSGGTEVPAVSSASDAGGTVTPALPLDPQSWVPSFGFRLICVLAFVVAVALLLRLAR